MEFYAVEIEGMPMWADLLSYSPAERAEPYGDPPSPGCEAEIELELYDSTGELVDVNFTDQWYHQAAEQVDAAITNKEAPTCRIPTPRETTESTMPARPRGKTGPPATERDGRLNGPAE